MQQPNSFNVLRTLHMALLIGMVMFNIVALILVQEEITADGGETLERGLQIVCVGLSTLFLLGGFKFFKKKILAARNSLESGEKRLEQYRAACIFWWAMIEGPGILAGIGFIITHNYAFFALSVFHVVCMFVFSPRKANIIVFLNLTTEEVARLEGATNKK